MEIPGNAIMLAANNDIVEMMVRDRLYWATRKRFQELAGISAMLESVIQSGGELSTIQHIFDEPETKKRSAAGI